MKDLKYLYFEVLENLFDQGIGVEANIKDICSPYAIKSLNDERIQDAFDSFGKRWSSIMGVLSYLEKLGYIVFSTQHGDYQELYREGGNFSVSITKNGFEYYYAHILRVETITSLKNQKRDSIITWSIAIVAVATTIYTIIQNTDLSQKLKDLNTEVQQLKSLQHSKVATHKTHDTLLKRR